jgi:hypothetical protein
MVLADWLGILFIVVLVALAYFGIRRLANPPPRTEEDFERNAAEGTTALGASMNALQELMNPEAAKAKEVQMQMKEGNYGKKRRSGKANGQPEDDE